MNGKENEGLVRRKVGAWGMCNFISGKYEHRRVPIGNGFIDIAVFLIRNS
jgi:hypothetical protein